MDCVLKTEQCAVYDNVLEPAELQELWKYMQMAEYQSVHNQGWQKVWRLHDGEVMKGPLISCSVVEDPEYSEPVDKLEALHYPTQTIIDKLLEKTIEGADAHPELIGTKGTDWTRMIASPHLYPIGSGLSWHIDTGLYCGAFSFYCNPEWNAVNGGELLISNADTSALVEQLPSVVVFEVEDNEIKSLERKTIEPYLDNRFENPILMDSGLGLYIATKPNRLVFIKEGAYHRVNPVSNAAGSIPRASVSGFFLKNRQNTEPE
ncbi:MAG: hypothetical protein HOK97_07255 [Deltaproteobacteria bacterium]|nr:hypothetical protein [Deltaproteobacteria bacterium]MBT6489540.1 hypothetical protein [Deltaproteobacteria bacterium]